MTLNLSKSVRAFLRSFWLRFLAHALSCHFASIPAFSHCALTTPVRAALGSFSRTSGVRMTLDRAIDWRGTAVLVSVDGPSMRACLSISLCAFLSPTPGRATYTLVVDNLNDSSQLSLSRSLSNEYDSADLYQSPRRSLDLCVSHFEVSGMARVSYMPVVLKNLERTYWAICRGCRCD